MRPPNRPERFAPLPEAISRKPDDAEKQVLESWHRRGVFAEVQAAREDAPRFAFWEGPPTANGRPGIHHVIARAIKDSICRYHTMLGKRVDRKAGWDTHGLPVELEVEKQLGISGKPEIEEYGIAEFNAKCRESVWTYRKEWEELSERIGFWLDYDDPYITYDEDYVESVWYILKRFFDEDLVYRGKRVVPYCGRCGTGLSSHEMGQPGVYRDVKDPSVTVRFRFPEAPEELDDALRRATGGGPRPDRESFLAWTTTPWTLPSNFALAVNPEVEYVRALVDLPVPKGAEPGSEGNEIVWVAAARADAVLGAGWREIERRPGAELVGRRYLPLFHPGDAAWIPDVPEAETENLLERWYHVIPGDFVTTEDGTGIVHQAPYGEDDWRMAQELAIPVTFFVGEDGKFTREVHPPPGSQQREPVVDRLTPFKDADDALMKDLVRRGLMFRKSREEHPYPHCWRCDTPLFYFPTPAWYIRTSSYKERMMEYNRRCQWVPPEVGTRRLGDWLENNIDWNISRDRYWGTPLPFWECWECGAVKAVGSRAELAELAGELPEGFDNHKPLIDLVTIPCGECGETMRRTPSVVDCWFDSGSMPYAQYHYPFGDGAAKTGRQFPADVIAEGLDQTRGWFYTLLAIGSFLAEVEPALESGVVYRSCVVNGLILDKDGVKMSKRLGNVVDPWEAIAEHGADAVRWYLLSGGAPWLPKRFDLTGVLEVRRRVLGTLYNSYRFFAEYARIDGFDPGSPEVPPPGERPEIDRWLLSRTQSLVGEVRTALDGYDLVGYCRAIEGFVIDELSNWYIRRNRRRFWKGETGADKLAAHATLHAALETVALLIAPVAPFSAELLWERLRADGSSIHAQLVPEPCEELLDGELEASMRLVVRVVEMGRALRERAGVRVRQPLRALHVRASDRAALALLESPFATAQVLEELNIKGWGSLDADDGELCALRAKADFKRLGKRLGKRMKSAATAISSLPSEVVASLRGGAPATIEVDGEPVELAPEDVQITVETRADFDVETDGHVVVFLDTELDEGLVAEGLAREVINRVNGLRKESGLAVEERIRLRLDASGDALEGALEGHAQLIASETLAGELERGGEPLGGTTWAEYTLGDGQVLRASLSPL